MGTFCGADQSPLPRTVIRERAMRIYSAPRNEQNACGPQATDIRTVESFANIPGNLDLKFDEFLKATGSPLISMPSSPKAC